MPPSSPAMTDHTTEAERIVLTAAVACVEDLDEYDQMPIGGDYRPYLARMHESQEALRAAVAALKAAEVAS